MLPLWGYSNLIHAYKGKTLQGGSLRPLWAWTRTEPTREGIKGLTTNQKSNGGHAEVEQELMDRQATADFCFSFITSDLEW